MNRIAFYTLCFLLPALGISQDKVGINTTAPISDLDIRGTDDTNDGGELQLATPSMTNYLRFFGGRIGDPNPFIAFHDGDHFHFVTTSADWTTFHRRFTIAPGGDVGIGTEQPLARLHLVTNSSSQYAHLRVSETAPNEFARLKFDNTLEPGIFWDIATRSDSIPADSRMHFYYANPGFTGNKMTLMGNGNVGIGLNTPLSKLDIQALGDGAQLLRFTTDRPWVFMQTGTSVNTALTLRSMFNDKAFEILSADSTNRAARFFSNNDYSKVLLVPDGGEVGVGIVEADAKLHVRENSTTGFPQLRLTETSANDFARIKFENEFDPGISWDIAGRADSVATSSRLNFYYAGPGFTGDKMTIMGNGNVGIGTTNPADKLHVVGTMRVSDLAGTGDRNVIVDSNGKFKIGNLGSGDSDWVETNDYVYNNTHLIGIGTSTPSSKLTIVGAESDGTNGGLKVIFPGTPPFFTDAQSMVFDGNEIDVNGTLNNTLVLQGVSTGHIRMVEGGGGVGIGQNGASNRKLSITGAEIPSSGSLTGAAATISIVNNTGGINEMVLDGNEIHTIDQTLNINTKTTRNVVLTSSTGGNVGIGITPTSKLTIAGSENNGTTASIEVRTGSHTMLLDGNELDILGSTLFINANSGNRVAIGTGTAATGYKLSVGGKIIAEEVRVQLIADWPDYVFSKDYPLMPLEEVKESINLHGHLPGIPSATEIGEDGLHLGDMQRMMMEKIEELTLHVINLNERIETLEHENTRLQNAIEK